MKRKDFLRVTDYTKAEIEEVFAKAKELKDKFRKGEETLVLKGKTLAMIFQKSSTRTRVSFESGMFQLGGYPMYLGANDLQLNRGETISDTARVLSRMVDGIMIRTYKHSDVEELARTSDVPVINGLTDDHHPCQILADVFTLIEKRGSVKGLTVAWIGDGNNVMNSWMEACPLLGMNFRMGVPEGYDTNPALYKEAEAAAKKAGTKFELFRNPVEAIKGADVVYADVWTSMGQEAQNAKRLHDFKGYQINADLMKHAHKDALLMHCLPAHRGEEVSAEVLDGPQSIIFDEAENRMHLQKGILALHLAKNWRQVH
ncbi:MAG: ornithine carbamoyltransferase [Elusimicrobiaceae bacterium]